MKIKMVYSQRRSLKRSPGPRNARRLPPCMVLRSPKKRSQCLKRVRLRKALGRQEVDVRLHEIYLARLRAQGNPQVEMHKHVIRHISPYLSPGQIAVHHRLQAIHNARAKKIFILER